MFGPFINNFQTIRRLDILNSIDHQLNNFIPPTLMAFYCCKIPPHLTIVILRSNWNNLYFVLLLSMLIMMSCPSFSRLRLKNGKLSKKLIKEKNTRRNVLLALMIAMNLICLTKGISLIVAFVFGTKAGFFDKFYNLSKDQTFHLTEVLSQGGFTLILESAFLYFMNRCVKNYTPYLFGIKECYYNLQKMNSMTFFLMREFMDYIGLVIIIYKISWIGFILGGVICLALVINCPAFRPIAPSKYVVLLFITCATSFTLATTLFFSTEKKIFQIFGSNTNSIGANLNYRELKITTHLRIKVIDFTLDVTKWTQSLDQSNFHSFFMVILFLFSCLCLWRGRLGALGHEYFKDEIDNVKSKPPNETFKGITEEQMKKIRKSYYINFFVKKASLIMDIDWHQGLQGGSQLTFKYLEDIPYLDKKKLAEKYKFYADFKNMKTENNRLSIHRLIEFFKLAVYNSISLSNLVNLLLLGWLIFFMEVKNNIPTFFIFICLIAIGGLGVFPFSKFLRFSQFMIVIPLFLNFLTTYSVNVKGDPFKCKVFKMQKFLCYHTLGFNYYEKASQARIQIMTIFFIFKFFTFLLSLLKISDHFFKEKTKTEMLREIEESFSKGQIPLIKIMLVKVASKMYLICYVLMVYVGSRGSNITSMILFCFFLIFVSSKRLILENWNIFYFSLNIIVMGGFLLDLIVSSINVNAPPSKFIQYVGLPSLLTDNENKNQSVHSLSQRKFLVLYICCLIQQIASSNQYIKIYMAKVARINDKKSMIVILRKHFKKIEQFFYQIYYRFGIWLAYILNITLSMTLSITVGRCVLLVFQFYIMIWHLEAKRKANISGHLDLRKVLKLWNRYFLVKIFVLVMMLTGTFIMNSWIRSTYLNIKDDDLNFEILNYIGIENLEERTIRDYPNLSNCTVQRKKLNSMSNLLWYFISEGLMFITSRMAISIIRIQMIYYDNIHGFLRSGQRNILLKLKKKPKLYRIFKIYHKYVVGKLKAKNDKLKFIDEIITFIARIYTTVIYVVVLWTSISLDKICLLVFTYLVYFFMYFLRINKTFLDYVEKEDVEEIVGVKLDYFYDKYLSRSALTGTHNKYDKVIKGMDLSEDEQRSLKCRLQDVKGYISKNLLMVSVRLRLRITKFEIENKNKIYWASVLVSVFIINLSYISGLIEYFPYFTRMEETNIPSGLALYRTFSKIIGIDFQMQVPNLPKGPNLVTNESSTCFASNMFPFVVLFFFSSADVYVMKLISSLEAKLSRELETLEKIEEELNLDLESEYDSDSDSGSDESLSEMAEGGGSSLEDSDKESKKTTLEQNREKHNQFLNLQKMHVEKDLFNLDQSSFSSIEDEDDKGRVIDKEEKKKREFELLKHEEYEEDIDYETALRIEQREIYNDDSDSEELSSDESQGSSNEDSDSKSNSGSSSESKSRKSKTSLLEFDVNDEKFKKGKLQSLGAELLDLGKIRKEEEEGKEGSRTSRILGFLTRKKSKKGKSKKKDTVKKVKKRIWNFTEFYIVSENEEEQGVRNHIAYKTMLKAKNLSSASSQLSFENSDDEKNHRFPDMKDSKDNIITFYYKNMGKYNLIKMWKSIMEITQKIIAALLILILLFKGSIVIIVLYLLYIIYFYRNKVKNVKTLQITAIFLVLITLVQYLGLLLGQKVSVSKTQEMQIWKYFYKIATGKDAGDRDLTAIGIYDSSGNANVIYDSIPTIFFQLIIFTYDIFLFTVSRAVEYTLVKVKSNYMIKAHDSKMNIITFIDYKKWKDLRFKVLQTFLNIMYVRINEIVIIVQLIINILSPPGSFWNMIRLVFIVTYFSKIGFRSVGEFDLVSKRIKNILRYLMRFIWLRVLLGKVFEITAAFISFYVTNFHTDANGKIDQSGISINNIVKNFNNQVGDQLNPQSFIKVLIVIELFLVELVYSLYNSEVFLKRQKEIIDKKILRSKLISICMSYETNERKLMGVISGYQEKIKLAKEIKKINERIKSWKRHFRSGGKARSGVSAVGQGDAQIVAMSNNAVALREQTKLKIKEQTDRLVQTSPTKVKVVFTFYKIMKFLKNKFMFMNILGLYDHICQRNNQLVLSPTVKLKTYLSNDFKSIEYNVHCIKSIYKAYSNEVQRTKAKKFNKNKLIERKKNVMKTSREDNAKLFDFDVRTILSRNNSGNNSIKSKDEIVKRRLRQAGLMIGNIDNLMKRRRGINLGTGLRSSSVPKEKKRKNKTKKDTAMPKIKRTFSEAKNILKEFDRFNFKMVKIDTENKHYFYKVLLDDEILTQDSSVLNFRVVTMLILEVIISNWHNICYIALASYCFINGGLGGFIFIFLIVAFVLIEEGYPSLIFWRLSFFNSCISVFLKQLFVDIILKPNVQNLNNNNQPSSFGLQMAYQILGNSSYVTDCFILIMILIQLVLLDEIGLKKVSSNDLEDASTGFVRMRLNKVFQILFDEKWKLGEKYLSALFNACKKVEDKQWEDDDKQKSSPLRFLSRKSKKNVKKLKQSADKIRKALNRFKGTQTLKQLTDRSELSKGDNKEADKINLKEIFEFENLEKLKMLKALRGTAKNIDGIFLSSFSKLSEKNTKSFLWKKFSIYSRKPGIDLSPLINISLFIFMMYSAFTVNSLLGESKTFIQQVYVSNSVSLSVIICFAIGISMLIAERVIYKNNPPEWRENYESRMVSRKPLNIEELHLCIREQIEKGVSIKDINWEKLNIKKDNNEGSTHLDEDFDMNYMKNPLLLRYRYLIVVLSLITIIAWILFPMAQNRAYFGSWVCLVNLKNGASNSSKCSFFQSSPVIQGFFGVFLIYASLSALQIRYGEPINKGKRVLMGRTDDPIMTKILFGMNKVIRKVPFFFSIATMLDYLLTPTAIDFWEWTKFESIYDALYNDIYQMKAKDIRIPGIKIKKFPMKYAVGVLGSVVQIAVLVYPFIFFGNYFGQQNNVMSGWMTIDLVATKGVQTNMVMMNLYHNEQFKSINKIDQIQYVEWFQGSQSQIISGFQLDAIQVLTFYEKSSRNFNPTISSLDQMLDKLNDDTFTKNIILTVTFEQTAGPKKIMTQNVVLQQSVVDQFIKTFRLLRNINGQFNRTAEIIKRDLFIKFEVDSLVKIPNNAKPIYGSAIESLKLTDIQGPQTALPSGAYQNGTLIVDRFKSVWSMKMLIDETNYIDNFRDVRWNAKADNPFTTKFGENDNTFVTVIVDSSSSTSNSNKTIISTYTSVVFAIGSSLAAALTIFPEAIWTIDLPEAHQIIQICEAIVIARSDEKLDEEKRLFYQLIDLIRSPELIKSVSKDYDEHVLLNRARHTKQQVWLMKRKMYLEKLKEAKEQEKKRLKEEKKRLKARNMVKNDK